MMAYSKGRATILLTSATAVGQATNLAAAPLLARILYPWELGEFSAAYGVAAVLAVALSLRMDLAVTAPADPHEADKLAWAAVVLSLLGGFLISIVLWVLERHHPPTVFGIKFNVVLLIGPAAGSLAAVMVLTQLAARRKRFDLSAIRALLLPALSAVLMVAAGLLDLSTPGLLGAMTIAQISVATILVATLKPATSGLDVKGLTGYMRKYRRFPLIMAPTGVVNILGLQAPILLFTVFFGSEEAGFLAMTQKVLAAPVAILGVACSQVLVSDLIAARDNSKIHIKDTFWRATQFLGAVAVGIVIVTMLFAPSVFSLLLGERWVRSGEFAVGMAFGVGAQFVAVPLSQSLVIQGHLWTQVAWDAARLALAGATITIAWLAGANSIVTAWLLGGAMLAAYVSLWRICWVRLGRDGVEKRAT